MSDQQVPSVPPLRFTNQQEPLTNQQVPIETPLSISIPQVSIGRPFRFRLRQRPMATPLNIGNQRVPIATPLSINNQQVPMATPFGTGNQQGPIATPLGINNQQVPMATPFSTGNPQVPLATPLSITIPQHAQAAMDDMLDSASQADLISHPSYEPDPMRDTDSDDDEARRTDHVTEVRDLLRLESMKAVENHNDEVFLLDDGEEYQCVLRYPPDSATVYRLCRLEHTKATVVYETFHTAVRPLYVTSARFMTKDLLQECVDAVRSIAHVGWSSAHYAAQLQLIECFDNDIVLKLASVPHPDTKVTPLMVAAGTGNNAIIQKLLEIGVPVDARDRSLWNVYHYASSPESLPLFYAKHPFGIKQLTEHGENALNTACITDRPNMVQPLIDCGAENTQDKFGRYSIHLALLHDNIECVAELLRVHDHDDEQEDLLRAVALRDLRHHATPLHWAKSRRAVFLLAEHGAELNAKNNSEDTPLHTMITCTRTRGRLECVTGLLVHGADTTVLNRDGLNALHAAVLEANYSVVKALIVFGADVNRTTVEGFSARHICRSDMNAAPGTNKDACNQVLGVLHAEGAIRCAVGMNGCTAGCAHYGVFDGTVTLVDTAAEYNVMTTSMTDPDMPGHKVLCMDGGGVRCLITIALLKALEKSTDKTVNTMFDWIGGTSTGALIALGLSMGKSTDCMLKLCLKLKDEVFCGKPPYDTKRLDQFLMNMFGDHNLADIKHGKVLVTYVNANKTPAELKFFKNYKPPNVSATPETPRELENQMNREKLLWIAARASGVAPYYIHQVGGYLDGALMANNPTVNVLTEIAEYNRILEEIGKGEDIKPMQVVISLGTGRPPPASGVDVSWYNDTCDFLSNRQPNDPDDTSSRAKAFVSVATESGERAVARSSDWCESRGIPFYRLSPQLEEDIALNCPHEVDLVNMLYQTHLYMNSHPDVFAMSVLLKN